jgi:ABC-type uncharacterized transport system permease subunit
MTLLLLTVLSLLGYSVAAAFFLTEIYGAGRRGAFSVLVGCVALNFAAVSALVFQLGGHAAFRTGGFPATLALVLGIGLLLLSTRIPIRTSGALIAPLNALLLSFFLVDLHRVDDRVALEGPLLAIHVGLVTLGVGAFVLAAAMGALLLVQERELRRREFGPLFRALPGVGVLDQAGFQLVALGFVLYTIGLVLGVVAHLQSSGGVDIRIVLAGLAWVLFGVVITSRVFFGWRGRTAAMMTIGGCLATLAVLFFYSR